MSLPSSTLAELISSTSSLVDTLPTSLAVVITSTALSSLAVTQTLLSGEPSFESIPNASIAQPSSITYSDIFLITLASLGGLFLIGAIIFAIIHKRSTKRSFDTKPMAAVEEGEKSLDPGLESDSFDGDNLHPEPIYKSLPRPPNRESTLDPGFEPSPLRNSVSKIDQDGIYVVKP
jgi:hypothetical protein